MPPLQPNPKPPGKSGSRATVAAAADSSFEHDLFLMLAAVEQHRSALEAMEGRCRPARVLDHALELVRIITDFADHRVTAVHFPNDELNQALAKVGGFFSCAKELRTQLTGSGIRALFGVGQPPIANRRDTFYRCLSDLLDVVERYFRVFTSVFPSSLAARNWVEAGAVFFVDLKRVVGNLHI